MRRAAWGLAIALAASLAGGVAGWLARGEGTTVVRAQGLAPANARVLDVRALRSQTDPSQLAIAWQRNADRYPSEFGLTIWQRRPGRPWRAMYERRIRQTKERNIRDLRLHTADVTRDDREDLLVVEDLDGTAGVYVYRLLTTEGGRARQIAARLTNDDRTTILAEHGELISYDGVGKDPKTSLSIHCCPRFWRRTVKRWNGKRLVTAEVTRTQSRPPARY